MRVRRTAILCGAGVLLAAGTKSLAVSDSANPYQGIVERNVFALKPPPPPPKLTPNKAPPPKITLTGITTILGRKQALMKIAVPAHPPHPAREDSYILTEGQRDGELEVLAIDVNAGTVKVNNHGTVQTLDFADNGVKLPRSSAPVARGRPPGPGFVRPRVIARPGMRQIPPRPLRGPRGPAYQQQASANPGNPGPGAVGSVGSGGENLTSGFSGVSRVANDRLHPNITPDEQTILFEAQRAKLLDAGKKDVANLIPATPLTKELLQQGQTPPTQ